MILSWQELYSGDYNIVMSHIRHIREKIEDNPGKPLYMGAGTNVQDRLIALHHLDVPWRPSDVGRILRTFKIKKNVEVTDNG